MFAISDFRTSLLVAALLLPLQIVSSHSAQAEKRLALVIGESNYRAVVALPNPANDAKKMSEMLGAAGFEVTSASDLTQNEMRQAISDFATKISAAGPDTVALLFYAGHGLQIDGENYLVPVDVDPKRESDIPLEAVRLNDVMNTLGALQTRMRIIMLDACRNNPFPAIESGPGHGLAIVDTKAGAAGSFISYSTSPGSVAEDGSGENSPYTTAVLSIAKEPNLSIEQAFKRVRVAVNDATDGRQIPWDSSSLTSDFEFFGGGQAGKAAGAEQEKTAKPKQPTATRSVEQWHKELKGKDAKAAYELVIADDTVPAYEAFIALFARPPYNIRVRSLLERRYVMEAWATAVALNTVASYEAFLAKYADSDLAATARKLRARVLNRQFGAPVATNVAALCPCPTAEPPRKKTEKLRKSKRVKPIRRASPAPQQQQPSGGIPPAAIGTAIGIGIGIGIGGAMSGGHREPHHHY